MGWRQLRPTDAIVDPDDRFDRRTLLERAAVVGLALGAGGLLEACGGDDAQARRVRALYASWLLALHPAIYRGGTGPLPQSGADAARFVADARRHRSDWDVFIGTTPFVDASPLAAAGAIEPWDPYLPDGVLQDIPRAVRAEASLGGRLYSWPFFLDVTVAGWNSELVERAGLDPGHAPTTWDEYLANARAVMKSGAAPYGCTFDPQAHRSLVPIAYSFDPHVYTEDGLFDFTHPAVTEALEVLKQMKPLANPDVLNAATTAGAGSTPDEGAFASQIVAYYVKYQNAPVRFAGTWPDPGRLSLGPMPRGDPRRGKTLFWTTGAALLRYGRRKRAAAAYVNAVTRDAAVWRDSLGGGRSAAAQLPAYLSIWKDWAAERPDWLPAWAVQVHRELARAAPIRPHRLGARQFRVAQPYWHAYLSGETSTARAALAAAMRAVRGEARQLA